MGDKKPQRQPGFGRKPSVGQPPMGMLGRKMVGEYITDLDMTKYLNYVVSTQPLKGVPAFDSYNVDGAAASGENVEFGNALNLITLNGLESNNLEVIGKQLQRMAKTERTDR